MAKLRLDTAAQTDLDRIGQPLQRGRGVMLFAQDEETDFAIFIRKGYVKITVGSPDQIVAIRGPEEVVGEMAAVEKKPRTASVYTMTDMDALLIPADAWLAFLKEHWLVTQSMLQLLAGRVREYTEKHVESGDLATEQRVAKRLVELANMMGVRAERTVTVVISQAELAGLAGTRRETVSVLLKKFSKERILDTGRQRIIISGWDELNQIADGRATIGLSTDDGRVNDHFLHRALRHEQAHQEPNAKWIPRARWQRSLIGCVPRRRALR
jgi:CRP-like cAMP-binding protein